MSVNPEAFYMTFPGLSGELGTVSFESVLKPGFFLRHDEDDLYLESKENPIRNPSSFQKDASFLLKEELWQQGTVALEADNMAYHYISYDQQGQVKISREEGSDLSGTNASFFRESSSYNIRIMVREQGTYCNYDVLCS